MSSLPPEEERFYSNTNRLLEALSSAAEKVRAEGIEIETNSLKLLSIGIAALEKQKLIEFFIKGSHSECWDIIYNKNETEFLTNCNKIFHFIPQDQIKPIKVSFEARKKDGTHVISTERKEQIWAILTAMVKISIKYIHKHRMPYSSKNESGVLVNRYKREFLEDVKLIEHAKKWDVILEY